MATISIIIPDEVVQRVLDAFAASYGWAPEKGTKELFAKEQIAIYIKDVTVGNERRNAGKMAEKAAENRAKNEIVITIV